jgi:hypothetical protein
MDWLGWFYLAFGVFVLLLAHFGDWSSPEHKKRAAACDRGRYQNDREALFIREVGDEYVTQCFGPALPI